MAKIGRNDPCPCGSGKKYKQCCVRKEQHRRQSSEPMASLAQIRALSRELIPQLSGDEAKGLREKLEHLEEITAYEEVVEDIEAAGKSLEAHRGEFEKLMRDPAAAMERAHDLFSEDRFAHLHFTVEDVNRAFGAVGYPQHREGHLDDDMEIFLSASIYLAGDVAQRRRLARKLMVLLPAYVEEERYLDALLIQHSAYLLVEKPEISNPFLFATFFLAYEEWGRQIERHKETLLHQMGLDETEIAARDEDQLEAMIQTQMADPTKKELLEAYYAETPMLEDLAHAEYEEQERRVLQLLEREDADCLYLSQEDVEPWVPVLLERLEPVEAQAKEAAARDDWDEAETLEKMSKTLADVAYEMAEAIFTPQRVERLRTDIKAYQRDLVRREEREAARLAQVACLMLERGDVEPAEIFLLVSICFASLREMMIALSQQVRTKRGETGTRESD
jgi:hypothetical protein